MGNLYHSYSDSLIYTNIKMPDVKNTIQNINKILSIYETYLSTWNSRSPLVS